MQARTLQGAETSKYDPESEVSNFPVKIISSSFRIHKHKCIAYDVLMEPNSNINNKGVIIRNRQSWIQQQI